MPPHTAWRVQSWGSRPFSGGFRALRDLAEREFSGAVVADGTWLFMLNGRVIGVFEGDVEDFEAASGTVYDAPHQSLPLLFSMRERGGETQAKYYTNDTPLSEADETLSDASFTGYVELSENVLSGDYYVVYYGGRSMSAAFVGASEELLTGEDAFERADDEVGVYEVKKAPVNVTSLPDVEDDADDASDDGSTAGATAGAAAAGVADAAAGDDATGDGADDATDDGDGGDAAADDATPDATAGADAGEESADASESPTGAASTAASYASSASTASDAPAEADAANASESPGASAADAADASGAADAGRTASSGDDAAGGAEASADDGSQQPAGGRDEDDATAAAADAGGAAARDDESAAASADGQEGVFDEEAEWRNARSVPTLDPEKSESTDGGTAAKASKREDRGQSRQQSGSQSGKRSGGKPRSQSGNQSSSQSGGKPRSTVEKLKRAVKQRNEKLEEAADRIDDLEDERDELRERVASLQDERATVEAERDELREEREELRERTEELEARLEAGGSGATGETDLGPTEALSGTNLFVRYDSKGQPTLDDLGADTDPAAVNGNLRIEHHTQFDAGDATVDGEDFESFLESSAAYRFVSWAVQELPFEIRDTGHTDGLADLYGALPDVDRAELDGTVAVDTEEGSTSRTFDVVLRDRMGDPLVVAELNAEREPVTGDEMDELVADATAVREGADELSAAMYVTASFFEPAALETAAEETGGGGFLSRSDRESFVKVGRKAGYHLCLVEDRNDAFHVTVPEL
jgi:FtsZ-binding cell division protein ZapB